MTYVSSGRLGQTKSTDDMTVAEIYEEYFPEGRTGPRKRPSRDAGTTTTRTTTTTGNGAADSGPVAAGLLPADPTTRSVVIGAVAALGLVLAMGRGLGR